MEQTARSRLAPGPAEMLKSLGVAALYALLGKLFLTFFSVNGVVSLIWPPSGLALAVLLMGGKRYAGGVFLGALLVNAMAGLSLGTAAIIAAGNTLEAVLGAWLLTRDNQFDPNFRSSRGYLRLAVLAGVFGAGVSALTGVTALHVSGFLPTAAYFPNLFHWWMGDMIGIVLITPAVLAWRRAREAWRAPKQIIEAVLVLMLTFLIGQVIFLGWFHDSLGQVARGYWMYLLVTWAAVRLGGHGVAAVLLLTALQGLLGAVQGSGFFADDIAKTQLANYWFYMVILSIVGMALSTHFSERKAIMENLVFLKHQNDLILNAASEGICCVDTQGTIVFANPAAAKMLGFSVTELYGRSLHDALHHPRPDGSPYPVADCPILASLDSGQTSRGEDEFYWRKDGSRFPVEYASTPIVDAGSIIGAVVMFSDITRRHQAEATLREWWQLVEHAAWGMAIGDASNRTIKLVNPAFARMHGYTMEELAGIKVDSLYTPESRIDIPQFDAALRKDRHLNFECARRRKNGSAFPALVDISIIEGADGKDNYIANVQDISAHKQIEAALRDSEELFRTLFGGITDALLVHPISDDGVLGRFIVVNNVACEWLGYSHQEMLGMTPRDIEAPDIDTAPVARQVATGENVTFEQIFVAKNGKRIPVEIRANPFLLHGEKAVIALVRDISERKQGEEMLRWSEERFRSTFEQAAVGMAHVSPNGGFLRLNQKFCGIAGYPRDELMRMSFMDITYPDDLEIDANHVQQVLAGKIATYVMEKRYVRKDRTLVWINLTVSLVRKADGTPDYFISVIEDITERKRAEQQLRELSAHLQTVREEEKAHIAREIHDDLGGTLTALKMDLYWLERLLAEQKATAAALERIESLSVLLDDAVSATRRIIYELRPTVLDDLGLLAALEWQCAQFHKRTGIECRAVGVRDDGYAGELNSEQSINLFRISQEALTNVSRHAGASRVEVELYHGEEEVLLSISDNGRGLPADRAIAATSYGMRGMQERVEHLGGTIRFDSKPGSGTTVTVKLPPLADGQK